MAAIASLPEFLLGVAAALTPTVIWQLVLAPARERFNLAKVLRTETQINLSRLLTLQIWRARRPHSVIADFSITRVVFNAVASKIAELPVDVVQHLIRFYQQLDYLDAAVRRHHEFAEAASHEPAGARADEWLARAASTRAHIDDSIAIALELGEALAGALDGILENYWAEHPERLKSVAELRRLADSNAAKVAEHQTAAARDHYVPPLLRD